MRTKHLVVLVLFLVAFQTNFAQLSTKHYIPPVVADNDNGAPISDQYIYISTPRNNDVSFTITPTGDPTNVYSGLVSNASPFVYRVVLDGEDPADPGAALDRDGDTQFAVTAITPGTNLFLNTVLNDRGYIIEANDVIFVSVRFRSDFAPNQFHAGALVSKGISGLGTEFRVGGFAQEQDNFIGGYLTFCSVMATENNTQVTFSDFPAGISIINHTGSGAINATLNEGETYIIAVATDSGGNPNDLIGSLITSNKPIVVNTGSATGSSANSFVAGGRDYGVDQIVDASKVGTEYIFVRGNGGGDGIANGDDGDRWENTLLVAHEDNTEIFVNGVVGVQATINAGEWVVIEGDGINQNGNGYSTAGNMYVQTSKPVFAYQGIGGQTGNAPNQGMFFVPPLSCENRGDVNNIANINSIGNENNFEGGISIVTNRNSTVSVFQNDILKPILATEGPFDVDGNPDYVTYKLGGLQNNVKVESTGELYCAYFNANGAAASGSFYSGFPSPPEINFNTNVATLGNCIPNITLESLNADLFDTVEWFFDDGVTGFVSTGNTTNTLIPTQAGDYRLVGTLTCSGTTFESQIIPVSLCPDDLDNDSIIDNVDIDLDDDGILNSVESRGDVLLDFTDTNQPILNFLDGSSDNTFITSTTTIPSGTASISGDTNSNFGTTVGPGIDAVIEYNLAFNDASNIEFTQNTGTTHTIVDGEVFRLIIGPNTKNITLLDPDNILLVDTDFDGFFETGVNNFSSSEIRFQFNPTPNGATPFSLVANGVDEVTFIHSSINTSTSSLFEGNIQLISFTLDSDNDGIPDSLDGDSDNDGIPDIIEALGVTPTLLGDANFDGLDDAFGAGLVPTDTDNDGIVDYLDLDADNDGVYDFFEAGHTLTDTDLDGRIDNAINNVGLNGILDALETAPDNFVLIFNISDPDTDTIFSYLDLESDGDLCPDVIEAGFTDPDSDDLIGTSPVTVDAEGRVTGIPDGYTIPNANYFLGAPILLNTPFEDVAFCEESTSIITIDSTAETFQWEVSTDGGTNWSNLVDNATYSGATTTSLQITNLQLSLDNNQYRVFLQRTGNTCNNTSNPIILTVEALPIITAAVELRQCDDDNDGFISFNLNEAASDISTNFTNETFLFYETLADAQNDTNVIMNSDTYINQVVTTDIVWARATSTFGCFRISEVTLTVSATVITSPGALDRSFTLCDDFLDIDGNDTVNNDEADGITAFDFSSVTQDVVLSFIVSQQPLLLVTYYRTEADALAELNAIVDPSNYRNIGFPNTQTIYVRVDNRLNNDCLGLAPLITLTVDPVPTADPVNNLELCDNFDDGDFDNGIVQTFDLESQTATILGTQDPADYTVTYHTSAADALSGNNAITTAGMYENITPDLQTIFVRVENNTTGCFTNHTSFNLIVNPLPVANFVADLEICDDDSDGSAQNGFSQSFNLELQTATILGTQDPAQFSVTYHASLADAQAGILPLGSPFSNSVAFTQIIFVRVFNADSQCANGISNFNAIVHPEPTTENISNLSFCDDDLDGDDTNGFVQNIDLDSQIPGILGPLQDEDDFTVTFHETQADASAGTDALSSPYTNTTQNQQTIFVRVVNDDTNCVNDDFTFDIIVNPLPDFTVTSPQIVCLNGPPLTIGVENPATAYDYVWTDSTGNNIIGSQITITSGGLYTVVATTTDGTVCSRTREIQVNESIIATISDADITIVDDSENNSITIDPTNLGIGAYEYALLDENNNVAFNYQDTPFFENLAGGFYTILVRDKNGCGTASLLVSVIEFPKFFTPNNDGIKDTWAIKGANSTFFPTSQISIFNRFGKIVAQIDIDNPGWTGNYNGKTLPSDDYWFSINLIDRNGVVRERKGNFSLLRR